MIDQWLTILVIIPLHLMMSQMILTCLITGRHIQIFESAKCRRHYKKSGKRKKVCVLSKTLQELQSWKKEIYNINKQSLQQQKPPLPSPNKHKFFKYKAPTLIIMLKTKTLSQVGRLF